MATLQSTAPLNTHTEPKNRISELSKAILELLPEEDSSDVDIAIDGDAGAGKDTLGVKLADLLHLLFINSGDFYRSIAVHYEKYKDFTPEKRKKRLDSFIKKHKLKLTAGYFGEKMKFYVNGNDKTNDIHLNKISSIVALFSSIPKVRKLVNNSIQDFSKNNSVVMGGRDIGLVVLPQSLFHIVLTASPEVRARRRFNELEAKRLAGDPKALKEKYTYESILAGIMARDAKDEETVEREKKKLPKNHPHPKYKIIIDTDGLDAEGVLLEVLKQMHEKLAQDAHKNS